MHFHTNGMHCVICFHRLQETLLFAYAYFADRWNLDRPVFAILPGIINWRVINTLINNDF